jgi:tRNA 2-thiouridine synthesizing protein A
LPAEPEATDRIDARGLKCPLPVLKAEKRLAALPAGAVLVLLANDPMAKVDVPLFCRRQGYACRAEPDGAAVKFIITKPPAA